MKPTSTETANLILYFGILIYFLFASIHIVYKLPIQPAEIVIFVSCIPLIFFNRNIKINYKHSFFIFSALLYYISIISLIRFFQVDDNSILKNILYYSFNFVIFSALLISASLDVEKLDEVIYRAALLGSLSLFLQLLLSADLTSTRISLNFNNPNQLAYFSLSGLLLLLITKPDRSQSRVFVCGVSLYSLFVILSFSLFAIASLALFYAVLLYRFREKINAGYVLLFIIINFAILIIFDFYSDGWLYERLLIRMEKIYYKISIFYDARGYKRIADYPEYILLGAAEGAYWRFEPQHQREIHSSLGTILFCYGIPGILLFASLIAASIRRSLVGWMVIGVLMVYGLAHQGVRSTEFWMVLAMLAVHTRQNHVDKRADTLSPP